MCRSQCVERGIILLEPDKRTSDKLQEDVIAVKFFLTTWRILSNNLANPFVDWTMNTFGQAKINSSSFWL